MFRDGITFTIFSCAIALAVFTETIPAGRAETAVDRGHYLVNTILACGNCHTPRGSDGKPIANKAFSGGLTFDTPAFIATAPNITSDIETGIGSWSDSDIKRALVSGLRPDHGILPGEPLAAIMPANFYKALLPGDLDAVVAYLRTLKPIRNRVADPQYKLPVRRDAYPDAEAGFDPSAFKNPVRRGAYLVAIGHCMECHSLWSRGSLDFKNGLGHGGRTFPPPEGSPPGTPPVIAANITSDPTAGIGAWSNAEIARAITYGVARDGHILKAPMAYEFYSGLKAADVADIIAYLRTLPPLQ